MRSGGMHAPRQADLYAALHALCQPLTAMSLALMLAQSAPDAVERSTAVEAAAGECQRAIASVRDLRALISGPAAAPVGTAVPKSVRTGAPMTSVMDGAVCAGANAAYPYGVNDYGFGGMA